MAVEGETENFGNQKTLRSLKERKTKEDKMVSRGLHAKREPTM